MSDHDARLLIVDDNEDNRFTLSRRLEREGYADITYAENGRQALDAMAETEFDLVLLDIMMPVLDGFETLARMKADERLRETPVIMISALSEMDAVVRAIDLGAEDHLPKPFNPILLRARVRSTLEKRRLRATALERARSIDAGTGLPNRRGFLEAVRAPAPDAPLDDRAALLKIGIDQFARIVEAYGPDEGECFVRDVAARLRPLLPPDATLARLDAGALGLLCPQGPRDDALPGFVEGLMGAVRLPLAVGDKDVTPSVSLGVATARRRGMDGDRLMREAETAASRAREAGGDRFAMFDEALHAKAVERIDVEAALRRALDRGEFVLVYQPIVSFATGRIAGFETLIRWRRGENGLVSPALFVPILEETGLIGPVGAWIIEEAARRCADWRARQPACENLAINVNVSGVQFDVSNVVDDIERALGAANLPPAGLKVEVTESVLMANPDKAGAVMRALDDDGVRCAIDDFGTGYSSFSYLHRFPFKTLKIDRAFVSDVDREPKNNAIVQALASLAHKLGMDVVCEGVERVEEHSALADIAVDYAQGFYLYRPLDAAAAEAALAAEAAPSAASA